MRPDDTETEMDIDKTWASRSKEFPIGCRVKGTANYKGLLMYYNPDHVDFNQKGSILAGKTINGPILLVLNSQKTIATKSM